MDIDLPGRAPNGKTEGKKILSNPYHSSGLPIPDRFPIEETEEVLLPTSTVTGLRSTERKSLVQVNESFHLSSVSPITNYGDPYKEEKSTYIPTFPNECRLSRLRPREYSTQNW